MAAGTLARQYPGLVRAIVVGNEGLFWERCAWQDMQSTILQIHRAVQPVVVTTSEPIVSCLGSPARLGREDQHFVLRNIHPIFESWFRPGSVVQATEFVVDIAQRLYELCGRLVLIEATGLPSELVDAGYSPARQRLFWRERMHRMHAQAQASLALFRGLRCTLEDRRDRPQQRTPR